MTNAIVVGAGPNGLTAAATLAAAGVDVTVVEAADEIGGGARSGELSEPGVLFDHCSSAHPTGVVSPAFAALGLERHGLRWRGADVELAHPLDTGDAGVLLRSVSDTAGLLGADGPRWRRLYEPLTAEIDPLVAEILQPAVHLPRHPVTLARFGLSAAPSASMTANRWHSAQARGLFGGMAAHLFAPLTRPLSSAVGVLFGAIGHSYGWPVAEGGSQRIVDALAAVLGEHGGKIETGAPVRALDDLPRADLVLLDVTPGAAARIIGHRLPPRVRRAYLRYRHGPAAFKIDLAVQGGVPWTDERTRYAATVHLGGSFAEIAHAESEMYHGRMPRRPFLLVSQQYLADPGRSRGDVHPVSAYTHVPHGYTGDATEAMLEQFERFAPGTRERIIACHTTTPADLEAGNANLVGGDIANGINTPLRMVMRPRVSAHPYRTGVPGVFLCSAATAPGAGVHGMCGYNAARDALSTL